MTAWREKLSTGAFLVTAELDPPRGPEVEPAVLRARLLASRVDAVNVTDGSLARVRMSGAVAAALLQQRAGVEAIAHVACRDRNVIALQADLLGAWALGVRHVLAVSGDPPGQGDHPDARAVFEVDATGLIRLVAALNAGRTGSGRPLDGATDFVVGCGANPSAASLEAELDKLETRVRAGACFCQTQPVFDASAALRFEEAVRARPALRDLPVLYGLLPLRGEEDALRVGLIPGMTVPPSVVERLREAGPHAEEEGLRLAAELAGRLAGRVRGLHFFPRGRVRDVLRVLAALEGDRAPAGG
jgi:methylenetetrahydrofolate reductase (NADPH)